MKRDGYESDSIGEPLIIQQERENAVEELVGNKNSNDYYYNEGNTSFFKTFFNGLNALSGVGILSTPYALSSGGWLSLLLLFAIAIAAFYSGLLIKRCMETDPRIRTYPDIGEHAFGNIGRVLVSVVMYTELYLVVTGFLILEGDNLHNLFPQTRLEFFGLSIGGKASFIMLVALVILPSVWLSNMGILSYISVSGVLATLIILPSIVWAGTVDGIGFRNEGQLVNWSGIPIAMSLYGFCYCAHPVFPTLYTSMKKKQHFSKVLLLSFLCSTIFYASMAIFGYLMFGSNVKSQITLNLPTRNLSSKVAIYTTLVNPLTKYALMLAPVMNATESWFPNYRKNKYFSILVRTCLVFSQVAVALLVPFFGYLMSLVGAFLSTSGSITLPCLCYLKISGLRRGPETVFIIGIILLSVLIVVFGTYSSVTQLIDGTLTGY